MKKLLIVLLIIGGLIMLRPINSIIRDTVGNIIHRGSVVTGEVVIVNGDGSYDVFIAGETKAYPKVFTLARNPNLEVGDTVRILYKNGCKELPIILPPVTVTVTATGEIFITYWTGSGGNEVGYIKSFTTAGVEVTSWTAAKYNLLYNGLCVDSSGNVYYVAFYSPHKIIKYDSLGNEVIVLSSSYQIRNIAISSDGFIFTHEFTDSDNNMIMKRSPSTLQILGSFQLDPWTNSFYGMAFYDNDRFYIVNSTSDTIEMWRYSTGSELVSHAVTASKTSLTSLAYASGNTKVMGTDYANDPWTVPYALGAGETDFPVEFSRVFGVASKGGYFYILGNNSNGGIIYLGKYTEAGEKIWVVEAVEAGFYPSSVGVYPF